MGKVSEDIFVEAKSHNQTFANLCEIPYEEDLFIKNIEEEKAIDLGGLSREWVLL